MPQPLARLLGRWRARAQPPAAAPSPRASSAAETDAFERLLADLHDRVPDELRETFQDAVRAHRGTVAGGPELLDAIDRDHLGLGVAIGRGDADPQGRHARLGCLVAWLYEALGRPQNTRFAVVARAAAALRAQDGRSGGPP